MLPASTLDALTRLDAGTLTALVRALLQAEVQRLGLRPDALVMSEQLNVPDGGHDAELRGVPNDSPILPPGDVGIQLKSNKTTAPSALDLPAELSKPLPKLMLEGGGTYLLVWPQQFNPEQSQRATEALQTAADAVVEGAATIHWDAVRLLDLCERHPQVVQEIGVVEFTALRTMGELSAQLQVSRRPYAVDASRATLIDKLHGLATDPNPEPRIASVIGPAGTGKTRLIAEAFGQPPWSDVTLYTDVTDDLDRFIAYAVREPRSAGVIVADEIDEAARTSAIRRVGAAHGRWRVVTVTSFTDTRQRTPGHRDLVLQPLEREATERLVTESAGLDQRTARVVADVARGYPALAFELARAMAENPELDLAALSRLESTHELLQRALPDPNLRRALRPLALFRGLGVEAELGYELDAVAAALELDPGQLRHEIEKERARHRFVSAAGRYRSVSPTLVAAWLAAELIEDTHGLDARIASLPEAVQDSFADQLELFSGTSVSLSTVLARLLEAERFSSPPDFTEAAARLLRAAAAVVPEQVARCTDALIRTATSEQLRALPRRDLVDSLTVLLWFENTWETSIGGLWALAVHETESWANNASGQFAQFFSFALAGTTVPYRDRARWLQAQIDRTADEGQLMLLAKAAANGLGTQHTRTITGFRYREEPGEWTPTNVEEVIEARKLAAVALLTCLKLSTTQRREIAKFVGQSLIAVRGAGLLEWMTEELLRLELDPAIRGELHGDALRLARLSTLTDDGDEDPEAEPDPEFQRLASALEGDSLDSRIETALATPVWELAISRAEMLGEPTALEELATELIETDHGPAYALAIGAKSADPNTRFRFLRLVALRVGAASVGELAVTDGTIDEPALAAAYSVAEATNDISWADAHLATLLSDAATVESAIRMVKYLPASDSRLLEALAAAETHAASLAPLGDLVAGARIRDLSPETAERLIVALSVAGETHSAMLLLEQYVSSVETVSESLSAVALGTMSRALETDPGSADEYLIRELIRRAMFSPADLLRLWTTRLRTRVALAEPLDRQLTDAIRESDPEALLASTLGLIRSIATGEIRFSLLASRDLRLLSVAAETLGVNRVVEEMRSLAPIELRIAYHHLSWSGSEIDPLTFAVLTEPSLFEGLEDEAFSCFYNTLGTVTGSFWRALAGQHQRAIAWEQQLCGTSAEAWARDLVERYHLDVEAHKVQEAERDFRLGG